MLNIPSLTFFHNVVVVADLVNDRYAEIPIANRRDLEKTSPETLDALLNTLRNIGLNYVHYQTPEELARNAEKHKMDLILSIYGGEISRNRMALVPAICESFGLGFIGPDVYGRITAQDKEMSKRLAIECNLQTPRAKIIRDISDLVHITSFNFPVILKPCLEGSSIGISQKNVVRSVTEALPIAEELLNQFCQPIIAEEFVPGREVSYNLIECKPISHWSFSEIKITDAPNYFDDHVLDATMKAKWQTREVVTIDEELAPEDKFCLDKLVSSLGRYGYCRIDGKLVSGKFIFLEITPDAWLDPAGAFACSFTNKGWNYSDVIASVLASAHLK